MRKLSEFDDELVIEKDDEEAAVPLFERLAKDLIQSARMMTKDQVRWLVGFFYQIQQNRIRTQAQVKVALEGEEPNAFMKVLFKNMKAFEADIKAAMDAYTDAQPATIWLKSNTGIGPILAAGLYAHIDVTDRPYFGQIASYAGLNPTLKWLGKAKAEKIVKSVVKDGEIDREQLASIAATAGRKLKWLEEKVGDEKLTANLVTKILSKPPHNTELKTMRWKVGDCISKTCNKKESFYGQFYLERKMLDWQKNMNGNLVLQAEEKLRDFNIAKTTEAYRWYSGGYDPRDYKGIIPPIDKKKDDDGNIKVKILVPFVGIGKGVPMLPPAHIVARAKRYATKIMLSHLHEVMYFVQYGVLPPLPWIIEHGGHNDIIKVPNSHLIEGYDEAFEKRKRELVKRAAK